MSLDLFTDNLLSPPVLFFLLGIAATVARSDLSIPEPIAKLFSIYLLWAIGLKGGVALREAGLNASSLVPILAAVALSAVIPLFVFPILRKRLGVDNACALAASYGSVSVVTFITAIDFLEARAIEFGGGMIAALALMESPPIIVALMLRGRSQSSSSEPSPRGHIREALTSGPIFLLLGSLLAGLLAGPDRFEPLRPFCYDIFHGVLVLFLLEAGIVTGKRLKDLGQLGAFAIVFALAIPLVNAFLGAAIAYALSLPVGDAFLLAVLSASASYIAAPAVMRLAVPQASVGIYLPMSLGITFPFNVCVGIPLYLSAIQAIWPH